MVIVSGESLEKTKTHILCCNNFFFRKFWLL